MQIVQVAQDVVTKMRSCGKTIGEETHLVGGCEIYKEERDALEMGMREKYVCELGAFGRLESSKNTIAIR